MRRYISYILSAVAAVLMSSCIDIAINPVEPQTPATVTLQLRNTDLVATRVDVTDDSQCNEDLIENVQCFFTNSTNADQIIYSSGKIELKENNHGAATITLKDIPANILPSIAKVYVVANYADDLTAETSIAAIKAKDITLGTGPKQDSFVMDGTNTDPLTLSGTTLSGRVDLQRVAAKIVVKLNMNESIVEGGVTWTPDDAAISMSYKGSVNGSKISALAANANSTKKVTYSQTQTETTTVFTPDTENPTDAKYVGYQTVPFYSFPVSQADNSGEISIVIPWKPNGGEAVDYTYQIPVDIEFERNNVYIIEVNVGVLGSINETKLTPSYTVVNWKDESFDAGLVRPKYLVVEEKEIELFNESSYSIPYASSDDVTVIVDSISFESYRYATTRKVQITSSSVSIKPSASLTVNDKYNDYTVVKVEEEGTNNGVANFNHAILSTTFVPQKIYITIRHTSDANYAEQVVITQYPPIYLKSDHSNGRVYINGKRTNISDDNGGDLGSLASGVSGSDTETNDNQNMYNIYISSLPSSSTSVIGDPRTETGGKLSGINNLTNYRPTRSGAENVIAPAFKIASSWGKTSDLATYAAAERRCASYQESGYPAGRWRVPTPAEIAFIQERSANNDIPSLFNGAVYGRNNNRQYSGYWTSYGLAYWPGYETPGNTTGPAAGAYTTDQVNCSEHAVRCVYDIWYWGEDQYPGAAQTATWAD